MVLAAVGTVLAACMSEEGHEVVAVDVSAEKVRAINAGETPISEPSVPELIERAVLAKTLRATTDADEAVRNTEVSFVCVGTPSMHNGNLDLAKRLIEAGQPPKALAAGAILGGERAAEVFEAAYDEHAHRLARLFAEVETQ